MWNGRSANDQPVVWNSWQVQHGTILQWLRVEIEELGGINSQREEEEEEEWGCMAEELGGKTEKDAEEAEDICVFLMS